MPDRAALRQRLNARLLDDQRRVLAVLCGLNRCYHPGKLKGLASLLPELPLRPSRLLERFEGAYRAPLVEAVREHRALIDELLTLVERAMPEIDTGPQRAFRARSHGVGEPTLGPFLALAEPPR